VSSIADLAEHLGVDASDLFSLSVPISEDGRTVDLSLGELKDAIADARKTNAQRDALVKEREAIESEMREQRAARETALREAAAISQALEAQMMQEYQSINWDGLRADDPSEWTAKRQEMAERNTQLQRAKQAIAARWQADQAAAEQEIAEQREVFLSRERDALMQALPAWKDEATAKSEMAELRGYLSERGFTEDEISSVADHRLVVLANKARAYDQQQGQVDVAKKRVVKIGKRTVRPGSPRGKRGAIEDQTVRLRQNLKKSGRVEDAAALIGARLRS